MKIKDILKTINWKNECKIIFKKNVASSFWSCFTSYHNPEILPITISLKRENQYDLYHAVLHECLHVLIAKEYLYDTFKLIHNYTKLYYLIEYRVEKKLRKICKENGWKDILKYSDDWVLKYSKMIQGVTLGKGSGRFLPTEDRLKMPYIYAAKRIIREEKIKL